MPPKMHAWAGKLNTAFWSDGIERLEAMEKRWTIFPRHILTIADAKRGDIGEHFQFNTPKHFWSASI